MDENTEDPPPTENVSTPPPSENVNVEENNDGISDTDTMIGEKEKDVESTDHTHPPIASARRGSIKELKNLQESTLLGPIESDQQISYMRKRTQTTPS